MNIQTLDIISVNIWSILLSLINLLLLFLMMKKYLFKPVKKVMAQRQQQVDDLYSAANEARSQADTMRQEYETRLASAREEADGLVRTAVQTAQKRSDQILADASGQAAFIKQKAESDIQREKKQMLQDARREISDIAISIAEKVVEREIKKEDHAHLVDEFIRNVGEEQ